MPAKREPKGRMVPRMIDLTTDGERFIAEAHDPERSAYVFDSTGAKTAVERGTERALARMSRRDPALWLNDLLETADTPYDTYSEGFTRGNKAEGDGNSPYIAVGQELRPGFVAFLVRRLHQNEEEMAGHVVAAMLDALRHAGEQEQKWAAALALRLGWGLTQKQIADDMDVSQRTVSTYLREADAWLREYLTRQPWIQAYLYDDAAPRYHIDVQAHGFEELLKVLAEAA